MNGSQEWTSLREFARRCGRRHRAAQKAIEDGRIPASAVRRDAHGRIVAVKVHEASRAWLQNTDHSRSNTPVIVQPVPTSGAAHPAPRLDALTMELGRILGTAFSNALLPACAMAVTRQQLDPDVALNVLEDFLLATMFTTADALGLDPDDDRPLVLFHGDLEAALHPDRRAELLERIRGIADRYVGEDDAAAGCGAGTREE